MPARLAAAAQQRGGEQPAEPRHVLQRRDRGPGLSGDRRRQRRRQTAASVDHGAPVVEAGVLVPVGIVDQRIPLRPGPARAGERPLRPGVRGIDRGDGGGQPRVGLDDAARRLLSASTSPSSSSPESSSLSFFRSLVSSPLALVPVARSAAAPQAGKPGGRQRPVGFFRGDAAAGAQDDMGAGELVGGGADVHASVMENQIFEVDELAVQPQAGSGVGEVGAGDKTGADRAVGEAFVEPGEGILGGGERPGEFCPRQRIGDWVAGLQGVDNPNGNRSNGS